MNKWLVTLNNKTTEFDSFEKALSSFVKEISEHFWNHFGRNEKSAKLWFYNFDCVPFAMECFFSILRDKRTITDEEIVLESRLAMLCSSFEWQKPEKIKENALKTISKSFVYHWDGEDCYPVDIRIDYSPEEIVIELKADDDRCYLTSNAFIMDDENKKYFLKSHQMCQVATREEDLGKVLDFDIVLEKA